MAQSHKRWKLRFFTIWTGQAFSLLGSSLVQFALVWWLTDKTGSASVLAAATLVAMLPQIVLGPVAGTLVDRWNRRAVMIVADSSIALATLVLSYLFGSGQIQVWHIYAAMLFRSAAGAFHHPAMTASTSLMVPDQHLARVAGINQALGGIMNILGPVLGAGLLAILPMQGVLMVDVATAMLAVLPLLFIPVPQPKRKTATGVSRSSVLGEFRAGLRYVFSWPGLLMVTGMAMLLNFLLTPAGSLIPLLIKKEFSGGPGNLAAIEALIGIGVITGGLTLGVWGGFRRRLVTSLMGIIGIGVGALLVGAAPSSAFGVALIGAFIIGFMQTFANGPLGALLQSIVAPEMQGRVFTLLMSGATAMTPVSLIFAGPIADAFGVRVWFMVAGATFILIGILAYFVPALMNIETNRRASVINSAADSPVQPI